jgi:hypothetical protein
VSAWGRSTLSVRVGVAVAATISAALASYGYVTLRQQEQALVELARRDAVAHAEHVADAAVHHLIVGDYAAVDQLLLRFARDPELLELAVTRPDGAALAEVRRRGAAGLPVVTPVPERLPAPPRPTR